MSTDQTRRYIIAYDIVDDRRRTRVSDHLNSHGDRAQYSVFIIDGRPARLIRLLAQLTQMIDPTTDSILTCDLGPLNRAGPPPVEFIGKRRPLTGDGPLIV
ncbi:CRISPR-associated endonuclease Cas2 [Thermopolyspora sp. NPDC052614]|uniref:CRISPR-associated endonuclease Cas2 n=1 Tax=Thermopolyspora sp. NPDC052614 TaxID=3155682 RepID=UPI0034205B71